MSARARRLSPRSITERITSLIVTPRPLSTSILILSRLVGLSGRLWKLSKNCARDVLSMWLARGESACAASWRRAISRLVFWRASLQRAAHSPIFHGRESRRGRDTEGGKKCGCCHANPMGRPDWRKAFFRTLPVDGRVVERMTVLWRQVAVRRRDSHHSYLEQHPCIL